MKSFLFILLLISNLAFSQRKRVENLPNYDYQRLHFGFLISLNSYDFVIKHIKNFNLLDSVYVLESIPQYGFNLGIVSNLRLSNYFDLRFLPDLAFCDRKLNYTFIEHDTIVRTKSRLVESTFIDFPLHLKYKSARLNNFRAYLITGPKFSLDLASMKDVEVNPGELFIRLKKYEISYEVGFGFDFYLQYFKFAPELKFTVGIFNMLVKDITIYTRALESISTKAFTLNLTFE